jgi:mono/diheme cytochrome c family protein
MNKPDAGPTARRARSIALAAAITILATTIPLATLAAEADPMVARGRYLVQIAGCNDCHTPDYMFAAGAVDEGLWLTGSPLGWNGPWGTTYPPNLRLTVQAMTEDQWVVFAPAPKRPPMPWFALRDMSQEDVRAIYRYLKHLGPAGQLAPAALPPGVDPKAPVFRAPELPPPAK